MYLKVKVTPSSKRESIEKVSNELWHISVKEDAEMNRANHRIVEIIKQEFSTNNVRIISGHHSPSKIISID